MNRTMKTFAISIACSLVLTACNNQAQSDSETTKSEATPVKKEMVKAELGSYEDQLTCALQNQGCPSLTPLATAVANIQAYAEAWNDVPVPNSVGATEGEEAQVSEESDLPLYPTFAFGISVTDVIAAYGIRVENGQLTYSYDHARAYVGLEGTTTKRQHLYFTPVGEDGEDVLMTCDENKYVMELNIPCPQTCGVNSPLFEAFDNTLNAARKAGTTITTQPLGPISPDCVTNI